MPAERAPLSFERTFSSAEHAQLAKGLVPEQMEDKWFVFLEEEWLFLHRSWTGHCIYAVRVLAEGGAFRVQEAWVNRDPREHASNNDQRDAQLLAYVIDRLLLGRDVAFPTSASTVGVTDAAMLQHHVVGRASSTYKE